MRPLGAKTYHRTTVAKSWGAEAIQTALAAQGIELAPGRAARLARALEGFLGPSMADPLRGPRELVQACSVRIERWQPRVNAFVSREDHGSGVPLAHKDMFYRAGRVSNCGSKIPRGWVARGTSTAPTRPDAAGGNQIG